MKETKEESQEQNLIDKETIEKVIKFSVENPKILYYISRSPDGRAIIYRDQNIKYIYTGCEIVACYKNGKKAKIPKEYQKVIENKEDKKDKKEKKGKDLNEKDTKSRSKNIRK